MEKRNVVVAGITPATARKTAAAVDKAIRRATPAFTRKEKPDEPTAPSAGRPAGSGP